MVAELKMFRFSLGGTKMEKIEYIRVTAQVEQFGGEVREVIY